MGNWAHGFACRYLLTLVAQHILRCGRMFQIQTKASVTASFFFLEDLEHMKQLWSLHLPAKHLKLWNDDNKQGILSTLRSDIYLLPCLWQHLLPNFLPIIIWHVICLIHTLPLLGLFVFGFVVHFWFFWFSKIFIKWQRQKHLTGRAIIIDRGCNRLHNKIWFRHTGKRKFPIRGLSVFCSLVISKLSVFPGFLSKDKDKKKWILRAEILIIDRGQYR